MVSQLFSKKNLKTVEEEEIQLMKTYLSSPHCLNLYSLPFNNKPFPRKSNSSFKIVINSANNQEKNPHKKKSFHNQPRSIGNLQPPWLIPPPSYSHSSNTTLLFDHQLKEPSRIPISLRLLQLKKKNDSLALNKIPNSSELGSVGNAVWTLACLLENLHKSAMPVYQEEVLVRVSRDNRCSVVWLFQNIFVGSPELALGLIVMTADYMVRSLDGVVCGLGSTILEMEEDKYVGEKMAGNVGGLCEDYQKTKMAYEHAIVAEKGNSMILSNYAQLLYEYEKDFDRAGDYFHWAVKTEPVDPEAMSRCALFLWHGRGDIEGAEEMFLEAIQADPQNVYYRSNYVWFLNQTGGADICYPLNEYNTDSTNDIEEEISGF